MWSSPRLRRLISLPSWYVLKRWSTSRNQSNSSSSTSSTQSSRTSTTIGIPMICSTRRRPGSPLMWERSLGRERLGERGLERRAPGDRGVRRARDVLQLGARRGLELHRLLQEQRERLRVDVLRLRRVIRVDRPADRGDLDRHLRLAAPARDLGLLHLELQLHEAPLVALHAGPGDRDVRDDLLLRRRGRLRSADERERVARPDEEHSGATDRNQGLV